MIVGNCVHMAAESPSMTFAYAIWVGQSGRSMSAPSQMKAANKSHIQIRQRNVTRSVTRKLNNAYTHPQCCIISAENPAVEEKKVSYLEIISYRSNASRRSTYRPYCMSNSQPLSCRTKKPRNLFPRSLLNPQFPVGVEKRLSDSSCRTAGS